MTSRWLLLVVLVACKGEPAPPTTSNSSAPPQAAAGSGAPLLKFMPVIDGAKDLGGRSSDSAYTSTWCIDAADAIDQITSALRKDGWEDVRTRGQAPKIAIAGKKGNVRFSAKTGPPTDKCAGTYVIAWVATIGAIQIPADGEPIR